MTESTDRGRRRFLAATAMSIAGAHLGLSRTVKASQGAPSEFLDPGVEAFAFTFG